MEYGIWNKETKGKRSRMKQKQRTALLLAALCSLTGCGQTSTPVADIEETNWETLAESQEETESVESQPEQEETGESETAAESETEETEDSGITITAQHFEGTSDPDDPAVSYTYAYDLPQVTIQGNEAAQEAVQADLQAYVDSFLAGLEYADFGRIYEDSGPAMDCYQDLTMTVLRADEKAISIQMSNEGYGGGAHGWLTLAYFNYFPQTGERITFDQLGEGFREKAEELVTEQARKIQQEEGCFYEDFESSIPLVVLDGTEKAEDVYQRVYGVYYGEYEGLKLDATFYLTDNGFAFVSGQYVLQPYVAGVEDFEIPAEEFGDACTINLWN